MDDLGNVVALDETLATGTASRGQQAWTYAELTIVDQYPRRPFIAARPLSNRMGPGVNVSNNGAEFYVILWKDPKP